LFFGVPDVFDGGSRATDSGERGHLTSYGTTRFNNRAMQYRVEIGWNACNPVVGSKFFKFIDTNVDFYTILSNKSNERTCLSYSVV